MEGYHKAVLLQESVDARPCHAEKERAQPAGGGRGDLSVTGRAQSPMFRTAEGEIIRCFLNSREK